MSDTTARIALFSHRLAVDTPTGINRYAIELTRALSNRQLAGRTTRWMACAPREARAPDWVPEAVDVRAVPGPRRPTNLAWATLRSPRLERLIGPFDLLHVLAPVLPVPTRQPLVVTVHDVMPLTHPQWYSRRERWLNGAALRQAAGAHVITPSQAVAAEVRRVLHVPAERVTVIPEGGHPTPVITPSDKAAVLDRYGVVEGRFLLFVGAISPRKNLETVLTALAALGPRANDLVLLAVGPHPPDALPTLAAARRLGLQGRARFPGFVSEGDRQVLLSSALALVHPSAYEGFGLTPLEAMAAGTPVISSDAGSLPEVVGDAGFLLPPTDVDGWRRAIEQLVEDPGSAAALRERGRARAAGFTWERAAEQTLAVYEQLLAR